ncbi:MAG: dihydrodipicolinate reductase [Pseudomonadota bacterium]
MSEIAVLIVGLGPIGKLAARIALERDNLQVIGGVDIAPELVGRDLGLVLDGPDLGLRVEDAIPPAPRDRPAVAVLTTSSKLSLAAGQTKTLMAAGWSVATTCEEMAYPWVTQPELSRDLDRAAREAGRVVFATGVNPGFAMDALPVLLTGAMRRTESILVERFQDASTRRLPFQQKIGAGLDLDQFRKKVDQGIIRHVGFTESIHLIAAAWGISLAKVEEQVRPAMAASVLTSPFMTVLPGQVAGVDQIAQGFYDGKAVITLHLQAYFGHPSPRERILAQGDPPLELLVPGGIPGDTATCAITVNAISKVTGLQPGLRTPLDLVGPAGRFSPT